MTDTALQPAPLSLDEPTLRRAERQLSQADPVIARLVKAVGRCRLHPHRGLGPFSYLVQAILAQQISGAASRAISEKLRARFGWPLRPEHVRRASDEDLRLCGLSRQKASSLRDLAAKAEAGLPLERLARMPDERVIETLTVVRGIGCWTAEMYLIFRLARPDVLPIDDLGLRNAMRRAYGLRLLPNKDRMLRIAEPWRPYRTVGCWYLWRSLELQQPD